MFEIIFYNNKSEFSRVDKTNFIKEIFRISGTLKESCSILEPVITIEHNKLKEVVSNANQLVESNGVDVYASLFDLIDVNYCYIPKFERYYYIDDIVCINNKLWEISMSVDVLMTYKTSIYAQFCLVERNEYTFNEFLIDNLIPSNLRFNTKFYEYDNFISKLDTDIYTWDFNNSYYLTITFIPTLEMKSGNYSTQPNISATSFPYFFENLTDFNKYIDGILNPNFFESVGRLFENSSEYVINNFLIPLNLVGASSNNIPVDISDKVNVVIGNSIVSNNNGYGVRGNSRIRMFSKILDEVEFNSFIDSTPYSRYYLYLPFIGVVELDSERIYNKKYLYIIYDIDVVTGEFIATLSNVEPSYYDELNNTLDVWQGSMYIPLALGSTNASSKHLNQLLTAVKLGGSLLGATMDLSSGIKKGSSMLTPKKKKISKKGREIISKSEKGFMSDVSDSISNTIGNISNLIPSGSVDGLPDSILNYRFSLKPWLCKIQSDYYYPDNYNHMFGRPLMKSVYLKDLKGFTKVAEVHIDNINCTITELEEIEETLLDGVIL